MKQILLKRILNPKVSIVLTAVLITSVVGIVIILNSNQSEIDLALNSSAYVDLPSDVKTYVKDSYEKTGEILLVSENQVPKQPYLNPQYVTYLEKTSQEREEVPVAPTPTVVSFNDSETLEIQVPRTYSARVYSNQTSSSSEEAKNIAVKEDKEEEATEREEEKTTDREDEEEKKVTEADEKEKTKIVEKEEAGEKTETKEIDSPSKDLETFSTDEDLAKIVISDDSVFPSSYDARDVNGFDLTSDIRAQGSLGICWAIASTEAAETLIRNRTLAETNTLPETKLNLSTRQLDYAMSTNGITDFSNPYVSFLKRNVGTGGNFFIATIGMSQGISMVPEDKFKTTAENSSKELQEVLSHNNSEYELTGTINLPTTKNFRLTGEDTTDKQIRAQRLLVNLTKQYLLSFGSGCVNTYMDGTCQIQTRSGEVIIDHYNCSSNTIHALQIIGWDDQIEYNYCADTEKHEASLENCQKVVNGKGAWLLQNSWGKDSLPYLYLAYDSTESDIAFVADIKKTSERSWDNNYLVGAGTDVYRELELKLDETSIRGTETLDSLKFIANAMSGEYLISIKENKDSEPVTKTVEALMPGLVTISDFEANLSRDSIITIVGQNGGAVVDRVGIFTKNQDPSPFLSLANFPAQIEKSGTLRIYSDTKNLASGSEIQYRLTHIDANKMVSLNENSDTNNLDSTDKPTDTKETNETETNDFSQFIDVQFNQIAANNLNPLITFKEDLPAGYYNLSILNNEQEITNFDFTFKNPTPENQSTEILGPTENPENTPSQPVDPEPINESPPPGETGPSYSIDYQVDQSGYLKLPPGTTLADLTAHFHLGTNTTLTASPSTYQREKLSVFNLAGTNLIGTGATIRVYYGNNLVRELTVAMAGDVNGDGRVSPIDLVMIKQHLLGIAPATGPHFDAADVVGNNQAITPSDLVRICQHLLNINPLN